MEGGRRLGFDDGAVGFLWSFGPLCEPKRQERLTSRDRLRCAVGGVPINHGACLALAHGCRADVQGTGAGRALQPVRRPDRVSGARPSVGQDGSLAGEQGFALAVRVPGLQGKDQGGHVAVHPRRVLLGNEYSFIGNGLPRSSASSVVR